MATIIDALVVTLSLDNSKYVKGSKDAREELKRTKREISEDGRRIADDNKRVAESFQNITKSAVGMFAAVVGANGIRQFVTQTITGLSQIERQAKMTGMNLRDIYAFGSSVQGVGGDRGTAQSTVGNLSSKLYQLRTTGQGVDPSMIGAMQMMGINASDSGLNAIRKFAKYSEGKNPQQAAMMGGYLGLDEGTITLALKGLRAFDMEMASAQKTAPTEAEAQKAIAAQKAISELQIETIKLGRELAVDALPGITAFVHGLDDMITKFPDATKALMALIAGLSVGATIKGGLGMLGIRTGAMAAGAGVAGGSIWGAMGGIAAGALPFAPAAAALAYSGGLANSDAGRSGRAAMIRSWLKAHNYSDKDISAIMAGMAAENGSLDPSATNPIPAGDGSHAHGLFQLTAGRQAAYAAATGKDYMTSTMGEQLAWMSQEFGGSEKSAWNAIHNAPTSAEGASAYIKKYMRPGRSEVAADMMRANMELTSGVGATVNVGDVVIHTQATDAKGMAAAAIPHLTTAFETAMTNGGLR